MLLFFTSEEKIYGNKCVSLRQIKYNKQLGIVLMFVSIHVETPFQDGDCLFAFFKNSFWLENWASFWTAEVHTN